MAGLGKKTFTAGDVLTASDVNNYLMDQTVMVFAGTAARSSAIPTPSEGMFAVTTDNDQVDYYNGSAWVPALPVGAWQSWAPTLGDGWLNGNGVWDAFYTQIGKFVHVEARFTIGTTTTKGTSLLVSIPVTAKRGQRQAFGAWGSRGPSPLYFTLTGTTFGNIYTYKVDTTYATYTSITATVPVTWVPGDIISFAFTYEAA